MAAAERDFKKRIGRICRPSCTLVEMVVFFVLESLRLKDLWPPRKLRSRSLRTTLRALEDESWTKRILDRSRFALCDADECIGSHYFYGEGVPTVHDVRYSLRALRKESQEMIKPLCYECVRRDETSVGICEHNGLQNTGET